MIGQTLSHYRITAALGAGGMGEVYRATDTKLGRDVAIKVLPPEVAEDAERLTRFEREAQVLAALNHPNVGAIYGLEEADAKPFLVLELVEGEELQQRLGRGSIPMDEALEIARQIAEGLEAAHEKGVIHRDLKPANVKLTPDGKVKVLDFGLAKAWAGDPITGSSSDLSQSPTLAHTGTQAGVILGTAAYMSPEQARGKPVDRRTDVWAFGAVLWEMLTGRQLFKGDTVSDILAAVLTRAPDWSALPPRTPASVQRLLRRTLDRDARRRLQAIGEARLVLEDPSAGSAGPAVPSKAGSRYRTIMIAGAVGVGMFLAAWLLKPTLDPPPQPVRKLDLMDPGLNWSPGASPVISPDGTRIVYSGRGRLWVRALDRVDPVELAGTDGARFFFWSPDSTQIGYVADSRLWKITAEGGRASALAVVPDDFAMSGGGVWCADGRIVLSGSESVGLLEVPEQGGDGRSLLELDEGESDFHEISALPDDRGLLFSVHGATGADTIDLFAGGSRKTILTPEGETLLSPVYSRSGHLIYRRATVNPGIWAVPFSLDLLEATGQPFLIGPLGHAPSVSADGTLAYVREGLTPNELVWVSRSGQAELVTDLPSASQQARARLSPDASRVLLSIGMSGRGDVWSYDISRAVRTRLTLDPSTDAGGVWSADGGRVVFFSHRGNAQNLYSRLADGSGVAERLTEGPEVDNPYTVSPDGRWLLFHRRSRGERQDIWRLPLAGGGAPEPLLQSRFGEWEPALSPDGRWLAYSSDESGRPEVYVQTFPDLRGKQQVSTEGGEAPRWSRDGRELFFASARGMMAAGVSPGGESLHPTAPRLLFSWADDTRLYGGWDVAPDGRFLMFRRGEGSTITIVLNWFEELKAMGRGAEE